MVVKTPDKIFAFQDATGNRSLFYFKNGSNELLLSSHSELIADIKQEEFTNEAKLFLKSEGFINNNNRYFPGLFTPYKNIFRLTPNTLITLDNLNIKRFFPRRGIKNSKIDDSTVEELASLLTNQIKLLNQKYDLAVSLTAGIDSRLTLAACKEMKDDILFYTYIYGKVSNKDAKIAETLCNKLNLNYSKLQFNGDQDEEFEAEFMKNTSFISTKYRAQIAEILYNEYPQNRLHLKSNLPDIGKAHYRNRFAFLPSRSDANILSRLYNAKYNSTYVQKAYRDFIETTHFYSENLFNYDLYDLFYWENYIGNWQSLCLYEWDVAQDTCIIYNNRIFLKKMICLPLKDRFNKKLYYDLIKYMWSESNEIEINPHIQQKKYQFLLRIRKGLSLRLKSYYR